MKTEEPKVKEFVDVSIISYHTFRDIHMTAHHGVPLATVKMGGVE